MVTLNKNKHTLPPGEYYIGDPCYAIPDEDWDKLIKETGCFGLEHNDRVTNWNDGLFEYKGKICFVDGTAFGDGVYYMNDGITSLGVDSGMICIMPIEVAQDEHYGWLSTRVKMTKPFEVWARNGVFHFGHIIVKT